MDIVFRILCLFGAGLLMNWGYNLHLLEIKSAFTRLLSNLIIVIMFGLAVWIGTISV